MSHPTAHPAFEHLRSQRIESLDILVEEYRHRKTQAQHIHIAADNPENVFMVAFRTMPEDSTGVAHILEHTTLCGSEKYQVRDPFFMMIRRSLNTFMNAMTSSDWTAYPFASQNRKDYFNLLDVYLDAVFFSSLDPLDFAQEGHRLEFAEPDNPESELTFKGVVFNEMKGAMSSVPATLNQTLNKYLYPTTTYHHNSGGDPACIPDLTYKQLLDFYQTHYHPSNAIFMTFGDLPAAVLQEKFEDRALARFDRLDEHIAVEDEKRYLAPVRVEEAYAFDEEGSPDGKTHIVLGWLLGQSIDLMAAMEAHLLCSVLLDNSASPLLRALETTDLGTAPSPLCGLDDSEKELSFCCGIEGSDPDKAAALEAEVLEVLETVAERGIPRQQVEASLHQLELSQREITGDHYPYGLQLVMTALTGTVHRGDPVAQLDLDPVLARLRENIADDGYIKRLTRELLLDNQHRVRLTMRPEPELSARRLRAEMDRLAATRARLTDSEKQDIVARAQALNARQEQKDDDSILPKVGLADIPREMDYTPAHGHTNAPLPLTTYSAGTNGLVYQQVIIDLPALTDRQLDLLPLYTNIVTELGVGEQDYLETQLRQARVCGALHAFAHARGAPENISALKGHLVLSAKGLARNQGELTDLMAETLADVRFDELDRLRDLVAQLRGRREMSITGSGHALAMAAAASGIGPGAALAHRWGGLAGIGTIKSIDRGLAAREDIAALAEELAGIHRLIDAAPRQYLTVAEEDKLDEFTDTLASRFGPVSGEDFRPFSPGDHSHRVAAVWKTSTQVNFCARAYATVPGGHPDAAPLAVLGGFLRNGFLHTAIREKGGAYGGGASQDNHNGAFRFFSYRDPRNADTLGDFDKSLTWLEAQQGCAQQVEEAILGVISAIDRPNSPAGEAKQTFHAELYGNTREKRERFRSRVLQVTLEDLKRVAGTYLRPELAHTAVITHPDRVAELDGLGLEAHTL